jgi:hypothetical protein
MERILTPKVNESQEFIEIANDFSNPLDVVREAISNAYDANAKEIKIIFEMIDDSGEKSLKVTLCDDGDGMDINGLQSFFDLGNSSRIGIDGTIGEKGHGTKIYLNSKRVIVKSIKAGKFLQAIIEEPFRKLHNKQIPQVSINDDESLNTISKGTQIEIFGYNNNRCDKFSHEILKDYIIWFTKHGSFENKLKNDLGETTKLFLKGLNSTSLDQINFGHPFPAESASIEKLFKDYLTKAPDLYCKHIIRTGNLKNRPDISYQAIFSIEGKKIKYDSNPMIRRPGYQAPNGSYQIQERYGLWLCKDFIPIQRKNEWISSKGSEFTRFHAFFNCQDFKLTANRGSIENTPSEILDDIQFEIKKIYDEIINGSDWTSLTWLEGEAEGYQTVEKEKSQYKYRIEKVNRTNIANYKGCTLVEPDRESGVYALTIQLALLEPDLFPFKIVDYETHEGIDVIAKGDKSTPITSAKLFYIEFKKNLENSFNHSFANLHSVVCWDTNIKHDEQVSDVSGEKRKMYIIQPESPKGCTKFYLDNPREAHKIEVYVLKEYLKQKLGISFISRTSSALE